MSERPPRPITILDGMLLVGVTSVALAWCRAYLQWLEQWDANLVPIIRYAQYRGSALCPFLTLYSLTVLGVRLRASRAHRRRLWREPGFLVGVAAVFVVALNVIIVAVKVGNRVFLMPGVPTTHTLYEDLIFLTTTVRL